MFKMEFYMRFGSDSNSQSHDSLKHKKTQNIHQKVEKPQSFIDKKNRDNNHNPLANIDISTTSSSRNSSNPNWEHTTKIPKLPFKLIIVLT